MEGDYSNINNGEKPFNCKFGDFDEKVSSFLNKTEKSVTDDALLNKLRNADIDDVLEPISPININYTVNNVVDDASRSSNNNILPTIATYPNRDDSRSVNINNSISIINEEVNLRDSDMNSCEYVTGTNTIRLSNMKMIARMSTKRDLISLSKFQTVQNDIYSRTALRQGYAQVLRDNSIGQRDAPVANLFYKYHEVPMSADLNINELLMGLSISDAVRRILTTNDSDLNDREQTAIREFVKHLERFESFNINKHTHRDIFLASTTDEPFCDTCAIRFFSKDYLKTLGISLSKVINTTGLEFDKTTALTICHGLLLYGLILCRTDMITVPWENLAYAPHHVASTLAKGFLAERLNMKYEPAIGNDLIKSGTLMSIENFQRRLFLASFMDFWKLICYGVKEVVINDGAMTLRIPKVYRRRVEDSDEDIKYRLSRVSPQLLKRYANYKPCSSAFMPILKLFIDGRDATSYSGLYMELCRYTIAYYTAVLDEKITNDSIKYLNLWKKAGDFMLRGSFKVSGMNNGILLVEVIEKYDHRIGKIKPYDRYYDLCCDEDGAPLSLGNSIVDRRAIMAIINPLLLNVLNVVVLEYLSLTAKKDRKVVLTWCFEYGGLAVFCDRGNLTVLGNNEMTELSENIIDFSLPDDDDPTSWGEIMELADKSMRMELRRQEEAERKNKSEIFKLLQRTLQRDPTYSINKLNHNVAVSLIEAKIARKNNDSCQRTMKGNRYADDRSSLPEDVAQRDRSIITIGDFPPIRSDDKKSRNKSKKVRKA